MTFTEAVSTNKPFKRYIWEHYIIEDSVYGGFKRYDNVKTQRLEDMPKIKTEDYLATDYEVMKMPKKITLHRLVYKTQVNSYIQSP